MELGILIYVLIAVIFGSDGVPIVISEPYPDLKSCQVDASKVTELIVSKSINRGSVTCTPVTIGSFT